MSKKIKFWIPFFGGFFVIPGQKNYLDGDFFKHPGIMYPVFVLWHFAWIVVPMLLIIS